MRALVTGGAGFIGSTLVDALVARGDEVTVLDDLSSGREENLAGAVTAGARLEVGDVRDAELVARLVEDTGPAVIHHLAAQMDVRKSIADPRFDLDVNVAGTLNVLEAARAARARVVFASTGGAIYGEGEGRELPLTEDAECRPDAHYGQSKLAAEGYLALYGRLYGLETVALRLGNVYGPRQDPHGEAGVVAIFCRAMLAGDAPTVFGDGLQTRDYVFVDDVVAAFLAATGSGPGTLGRAFNVGTGVETTVLDLGRALAAALDAPFEPRMAPARPGEVRRIAIASGAAAADLAWAPAVPLAEGIARTAGWARGALAPT